MENKTISEYIQSDRLKIGGFVFSYMLGYLHKYELMEVVKSEYDDERYALLMPVEVLSYESRKWRKLFGFGNKRDWTRANMANDKRFNINADDCLEDAIKSLTKHIESSTWQRKSAQHILDVLKS